jgi:hypothetical protein
MRYARFFLIVLSFLLALPAAARAEDYVLTLKDHQFSPKDFTLPANQKIKLTIKNLDATPAEFESSDLNREKVVDAHGEIMVYLGPLDSGAYEYFDDFHHDTTTGTIKVK